MGKHRDKDRKNRDESNDADADDEATPSQEHVDLVRESFERNKAEDNWDTEQAARNLEDWADSDPDDPEPPEDSDEDPKA